MAKVTAPLFSFGARGQLAKSLVYAPWKGLNNVRSYVVPANPNSSGQQTQRGYLSSAVSDWHTVPLDADDVTAWNRFAATLASAMSGFNAFVRDWIAIKQHPDTPNMGYNGSIASDGDGTFTGLITEGGSATAVSMLWGTSPTSLINTEAGTEAANTWTCDPSTNVAGQTIYARFQISDANSVVGLTGIYRVVMP